MSRQLLPVADVVALYRDGLSSGQIAERYHCHAASVLTLLRRHGEPRRSLVEASAVARAAGRLCAPWTGKRLSRQHRKRIARGGPRHWNWKGGAHQRPWRHAPRTHCEACGSTERLCNTHRNNDACDWRDENRLVLCVSCHLSRRKKQFWRSHRAGERPLPFNGIVGWRRPGAAAAEASA
jgi:hypothetical protein